MPLPKQYDAAACPEAPDHYWVDPTTGEYIDAATGERMQAEEARRRIRLLYVYEQD